MRNSKAKLLVCLLAFVLIFSTVSIVSFAADETEATPTKGYTLNIYNADGTLGMPIDGTKSGSDFCIRSAIEDARVFANNAFLFGLTTPCTYEVIMYEDSTENESFTIGSDVTIITNGFKMNCAEGVEITCEGTIVEPAAPELPNATVKNLGAMTVAPESYAIYDLVGGTGLADATDPFKLQVAMQFIANDTLEEANANYYADYTTDFFITMNGIENGDAEGCYLAGYYASFETWVLIPLDGFTVEDGVTYPVITAAGFDFKYTDICDMVQDFTCGIYLSDEFLAKNPEVEVTLDLGLAENLDEAKAGEYVTVGSYTYASEEIQNPALPNATVSNLGAMTVAPDSYAIYDLVGGSGLTDATAPFDLQIAMQFLAKDNADEAAANYYADYTTDFFLTMKGIENGDAEGCYLAGYYPDFEMWVLIPLDGFTVEDGVTYPVITTAGFDFKYTDICGAVRDFTCGIYLSDEFLAKNPEVEVTLELGLAENYDEALDANYLTVDSYTYTFGAIEDGNSYIEYEKELENNEAIEVKKEESNITSEANETVVESAKEELKAALEEAGITVTEEELAAVEPTVEITLTEVSAGVITFTVTPNVAVAGESVKISTFAEPITFRLPIAKTETKTLANVYHEGELLGTYAIVTAANGDKYVEVKSASFSEYSVEPVAEIDVKVSTLDELLAALADNTKNLPIVITSMITIPEGTTLTIDLNGKTVVVPEATDRHIYALKNLGNLTLKDSVGGGSITARGIYNGADGANTTATMIVESGNYYSQDSNGGAAIFNYAVLTVNGGHFGGYIALNTRAGSKMTINGGSFACDSAGSYVIQNNGGELTINNATVTSGFGAVGCYGGTTVINDGTFLPTGRKGNTCHVVYVAGGANVTINGGTFKMNYPADAVPDSGSAVASYYNGTLAIKGGSFTSHFDNVSPVELSNGATITGGTYLVHSGTESNHSYVKNYVADGYELSADGTVVEAVKPVASINGETYYSSLIAALAEVKDGDVITLLENVIFTEANRTHNSGSWYDGIYYVGDKSFTIDLGGFTVSNDNGAVNDYLFNFKNDGAKANVITIKNGTLDAGTKAFCALCTSGASTQELTINLEDITLINNISNGSTVKIRGSKTTLNVNDGTTIIGKNSYLGIECVGATVNINDGAEIYMNGTASYNGCLVGVCGMGTVKVFGGYGKGVKGGFIAMTSGGTINISGGEWIANTNGTVGDNSNLYVLTAQNNKYESGYCGASIINVTGGTFRGGMDAWILNDANVEVAELNITGGNFNANPAGYVEAGYAAVQNVDATYDVVVAVAKIGDNYYATLADAIKAVAEGETIVILGTIEEGTIKLPAALKNVTFKGEENHTSILKNMTIMAADGNSFSYVGLTFDGIVFENSRLVFTGWRNGDEIIEDLTVNNCVVNNLDDTTNMAFLHINKDVTEPVKNLTFTNNVLDGLTGGSKSGIYSVNTGTVTITGNIFNNIVFRPALVQLADCDGIVDDVVISDNKISNTTRLQVYGSEKDNGDGTWTPNGTDTLEIAINDNIFENITGYYICTWGINGESDITKNYYDSTDLSGKIYWNNVKPTDVAGLKEIGLTSYYTELNADGTINEESLVVLPTGSLTNCYTSDSTYWGECGGNAKESFVLKFYNGDTYMGYTSLNNIGGIIDGDVYVSWHIKLDATSNTDEYWTMEWFVQPTVAMQPTRCEQWVDGVKVAEAAVEPNWSDKIFPVTAAVTDENGVILSYVNGTTNHTFADAVAAGGYIYVFTDVSVNISEFKNVTLYGNNVTITNTNGNWVDMVNVTVGSGVTFVSDKAYFTDAGVNTIEGTLKVGTLYNADNSKTTVQNGGKIITTGMIVNRYHTDANAGIYVYGDGDASTVEVSCADTIGTYSGTFYAKDAVVEANMLWIDYLKGSTQEADKYSQSTPVFENSTLTVAKELRLYKDATLTLVGATVTAGTVQVRENATPAVSVDTASTIKATSILNLAGATLNAELDANGNVSFVKFVAAVGDKQFTSFIEALQYAIDNNASEIKALCDVREKMTTDFEINIGADLTITADAPVSINFYNEGTNYDFIIDCQGYGDYAFTVAKNVSFTLEDRVIWVGYYGSNIDVVVDGTLAGSQIWLGGDIYVNETGTVKSTGEAFVIRRGKTLFVDGGKVEANYFNILSGNIFAENNSTIECGSLWISNTGAYAGEGNVCITLWDSTLTAKGNLKSSTSESVYIDVYNSKVTISDEHGYGASVLDANTTLYVNGEDSELTINKGINNNGTVDVYDNGTLIIPTNATVTNNGSIILEAGSTIAGPKDMGVDVEADDKDVEYVDGKYVVVDKKVATVNGVGYATLQAAVDAANGGTVTLIANVTTEDGVIINNVNVVIDLNGYTYTTTVGANTSSRNFKITGNSVVTIMNGTLVAAGDYSSGAYGTVRTEGTAVVTLDGLKLYNYRGNGLNIKACTGTTVNVKDTEIYSVYGGGIEAAGGTIVVENVTVDQQGMYVLPYNSMAISVNGGGKVTVNSGIFSTKCITAEEANAQGTSHGPWVAGVLNSGGTLIINGGTFSNDNFGDNSLATAARGLILADTAANIEINGGNFTALKNVIDIQNNLGDAAKNPKVTVNGGIFNANPTNGNTSNCIALGTKRVVATGANGTYAVVRDYVTNIGAGLRYLNASATSVDIRFSYTFAPEFSFEGAKWGWYITANNSIKLEGENYDSDNKTNFVLTGVAPENYAVDISAQIYYIVEIDGVEYEVVGRTVTTNILKVSDWVTKNSKKPGAIAYATDVLAAYDEYVANQPVALVKREEEAA